jgi:hypothetical protein
MPLLPAAGVALPSQLMELPLKSMVLPPVASSRAELLRLSSISSLPPAPLHQSASEVLDDRAGRKPEDSARRVVGVDGAAIVEVEIADESRADDAVVDVLELIGG